MKILGIRNLHDGGIAVIDDGKLVLSYEAEKDSNPRFMNCKDHSDVFRLLDGAYDSPVDVIAYVPQDEHNFEKRLYSGHEQELVKSESFNVFGKDVNTYETTHVRAHIFCSWALSPFKEGTPFYALVWEGSLGAFYHIDEKMNVTKLPGQDGCHENLLYAPGARYCAPFMFAGLIDKFDLSSAGKIMALASYGDRNADPSNPVWREALKKIFTDEFIFKCWERDFEQEYFRDFDFLKEGPSSQVFKDFCYLMQTHTFEVFRKFAEDNLDKNLPLVISGGCGLNCDWNTDWKMSGLFSDVFTPPCTNDSGLMIGLAAEAQYYLTGQSKIEWSPYAGQPWIDEDVALEGAEVKDLDHNEVAEYLADGEKVIAWVDGNCEIGPRALCHRSLIGAPFHKTMQARLNKIKNREGYRPIAPVCLESDVSEFFDWSGESPHMLQFQKVKRPEVLQAVTHVDNSARVQTVRADQNPSITKLLECLKEKTGVPVLCNTSLNFLGKGFINRTSDLAKYAAEVGLDGAVIGNKFYKITK